MKEETKTTTVTANIPTATDTADKGITVHRTKSKAGNTAKIPDRLPVITNHEYQNAMTFNKNSNACLQLLSDKSRLKFKKDVLLFNGFPVTSADLQELYTEDGIEKINFSLLMAIYGIILQRFSESQPENYKTEIITVYYPEFAKKTGKSTNITHRDMGECIKNMKLLGNVVGIIGNGTKSGDILPALAYIGSDADKNTVSFASPYITRLVKDIYEASIKGDKKGRPLLKKNGEPQMYPAYSYLIDMGIVKEKNKKAVEIVCAVVALIEQAGNNIPHIRVRTIIERCPLLSRSLQGKPNGNKNNFLKRAFTKAWDLLQKKTYLSSVYKNIQLPDPKDKPSIPTSSKLGKVFTFPHEGKNKNPQV